MFAEAAAVSDLSKAIDTAKTLKFISATCNQYLKHVFAEATPFFAYERSGHLIL